MKTDHVADSSEPLLKVEGLSKHFGRPSRFARKANVVHAADDVSFEIPRGQALGLVGESGSGKSTIARSVLRIEPVNSGSIHLNGQDIVGLHGAALRQIRGGMQAIFQDPASSLNPRWTIEDIIDEPMQAHGWPKERRRKRLLEVVEQVGLTPAHLKRLPFQLSGGQQQRVGIARALVLSPELIVADEPLSALDVSIQAQVLNLLVKLKKEMHLTFLFISHDLRVTRHFCENIAVCYLGNIVEIGPADEILTSPKHPYTASLVAAMPLSIDDLVSPPRKIVLSGETPSPLDPPSGCRFRTRCFQARPECALSAPKLEPAGAAHSAACFFPLEPDFLRPEEHLTTAKPVS